VYEEVNRDKTGEADGLNFKVDTASASDMLTILAQIGANLIWTSLFFSYACHLP